MRKCCFISLITLIIMFLLIPSGYAQNKDINIYYFNSKSCSYCIEETSFLKNLKQKHKNINIYDLEITTNPQNGEVLEQIIKKLNVDVPIIPFTVVGDKYFAGWVSEEVTGNAIEQAIEYQTQNGSISTIEDILSSSNIIKNSINNNLIPETLKVPFIGEVQTKNLSLQLLTVLFALVDGFNPCAMWILLFLISLLIDIRNKKRMWILGSAFIIASAIFYYFFMAAWLNIFLFLSFMLWIRIIIGVVALFAGFYNFREFLLNQSNGCSVLGEDKRMKIFERIRKIIHEKHLFFAVFGLIILAFSVNLIELLCSAGLPAIYTQILALNNLYPWQYYTYLALYVFIFMLDDLLVFFVAMVTLEVTAISTKYLRLSKLVSGILMLVIGALIILRPDLLSFK